MPVGGGIWLSSLIELMAKFGLSERLVRTGVYRLQKEGVLESRTEGRRAFYSLSELGRTTFETAERRIYHLSNNDWNGQWQLVYLLPGLTSKERQRIKKELRWQSFGELGPNLLARPSHMDFNCQSLKLGDDSASFVISFSGSLDNAFPEHSLSLLVTESWGLDQLQNDYEAFIERFSLVSVDVTNLFMEDEPSAFVLRTLLIHDYRRILLRDPQLPEDLLPTNWAGKRASKQAADLYRLTAQQSQEYVLTELEEHRTVKPVISQDYWNRFGGLNSCQ